MEKDFKEHQHIYQSGFLETIEYGNNSFTQSVLDKIFLPDYADYFGKPVDVFETVIISDIHLGSKVSRAEVLIEFLERISFKRLIINGDVFDSINMHRLNRYHWKVLSKLRRLTDAENHIEVIWIRGNHDGYSDLLTQLLGIKVYDEYTFNWNEKKILLLHGDIFDTFLNRFPIISDIADGFYRFSLLLDPKKKRFGRWLKRNSKMFLRNTQIVRKRAIEYAKRRNAQIVVCGHTHHVERITENGVLYLNPGSWTDSPSFFIGLTEDSIEALPYL